MNFCTPSPHASNFEIILLFSNNKECNGNVATIGNAFCDDANNNKECNYDGGDCCGLCKSTEYCTICECLLDEGEYHVAGTLSTSILNGNCDHALNKAECNFDAGDCCGSNSNNGFCKNPAEGTSIPTKWSFYTNRENWIYRN